jgi:tetratricopeptide (TPR) repeat protein
VQATLAEVHLRCGEPARAEELLRSALSAYEEADGPRSERVATVLTTLGNALSQQRRAAEAEPLHRRSLEILKSRPSVDPGDLATANMNLGMLLHAYLGRSDEAGPYLEAAVASFRASGRDKPTLAMALSNLALYDRAHGRDADADALYREAIAIAREVMPGNERLATLLFNRGRLLSTDPEAALACHEEARDILSAYPWELSIRLLNETYYGATLVRLGLLEDADRVFTELMPHLRGHIPVEEPQLLHVALLAHASCLEQLGQADAAREMRVEAR